jgi:uncharacterized membrane protein YgdD (TMEM256/DUF423 family)
MNSPSTWFRLGAASAASSVLLGAFGAHALRDVFAADAAGRAKGLWETAAHYHLTHAVALCVAASAADAGAGAEPPATAACALLAAGTAIFSGSLYALALLPSRRWLGAVTPVGGLLLVGGWLSLALSARPLRAPRRD